MMLEVSGLDVLLGDYQALWGAGLAVARGEIVALLGPNGSGKSTLMNSVSGLLRPRTGAILFEGEPIAGLPAHRIVGRGVAHVLERRRLFPYLTVRQNVWLGGYHTAARGAREAEFQRVSELFPVVAARAAQAAHTLSGGEQQMVAIARGLMAQPRLLMIDEPFLGLAPRIVEQLTEAIHRISRDGVTLLFIEQNVELALSIASRGYVLESGRTVIDGPSAALLRSPEVRRIFLGG
ncbi:MAG TPA: ABC transporter ATP-binding protein [Methylomirabilota bacterium]|jgi:branched-chain amino acid transport system ATP-binding protein|nr:ABC transporter ATP-binding protein [Methylomirabilota bacterium]